MPYFKKETDGQIVYRKHEFNSESLNGEIKKIDDYADCLLLAHIATKKFNWDVTPMETLNPEEGLEKLKELGIREESQKGQPFYSLVLSSHLHDYLNFHKDFNFKERKREEEKSQPKKEVITKDPIDLVKKRPEKQEGVSEERKQTTKPREGLIYKPKLVRDVRGEKPIKILR